MSEDKHEAPRCSRGAIIGANYPIEDAERDALLPPQRINWNIRRNGEEGPTMAYVREDVHNAALAAVRREAREEVFNDAVELVQAVTNDNDLDDGGFFEAGFIAARTKSIDALIEVRDAALERREGENK